MSARLVFLALANVDPVAALWRARQAARFERVSGKATEAGSTTVRPGGKALPPGRPVWQRGFVNVRLALRRLLPLLAVLSLALTPVSASAAAAGMHASMTAQAHVSHEAMTGMDHADMTVMAGMDDMPCCPQEAADRRDCPEGCPLMALCLAGIASLVPSGVSVPAPVAVRAAPAWPEAASFASLHGSPSPEPPRT